MTFPGNLLLNAAAGFYKGRNMRHDREYAENQDTLARNDRIAQQQQAEADRQQQRQFQQREYDDRQKSAADADARQQGLDTKALDEQGYGSVQPTQEAGQRQIGHALDNLSMGAMDIGAVPDTSGLQRGADALNTRPTFTLNGTGYSKNHASVSELAQAAAEKLQLDKERALASDRNAAATQQQNFTAGQNDLNRQNATRNAGIRATTNAGQQDIGNSMKLTDKYDTEVKPLIEQYTTLRNTGDQLPAALAGNAAAQTDVLNNFIRAMHPKGTPRESERKMIAAAAPLMDRASAQLDALANRKGYVVPPALIKQMADIIDHVADQNEITIGESRDKFKARAGAFGVRTDPDVLFPVPPSRGVQPGAVPPGARKPLTDIFRNPP